MRFSMSAPGVGWRINSARWCSAAAMRERTVARSPLRREVHLFERHVAERFKPRPTTFQRRRSGANR
jgi:hypothetical protein